MTPIMMVLVGAMVIGINLFGLILMARNFGMDGIQQWPFSFWLPASSRISAETQTDPA